MPSCSVVRVNIYSYFQDLGLSVLDRWRRADFDDLAFPALATAGLRELGPPPSPIDLVRWVHETSTLPRQSDPDGSFGDPPIDVFRCERLYIQVLFWVDGTTTVHEHAFAGAFRVLEGSSLHSTYRFTASRRYSERLHLGELELVDVELLGKGDVRQILAGAPLVHSLPPRSALGLRRRVNPRAQASGRPQLSYSRGGIAFDPFAKPELMTKRIQTLDLLDALHHPEFEPIARNCVREADSFVAFRVLHHLRKRMQPHRRYLAFLESIRPSHDALIDAVVRHAEETLREAAVIRARGLVKEPELRFFLALLLNVPERTRILEMIGRAYPGRTPAENVIRWVRELAKLDAVNAWVADVAKTDAEAGALALLDVPMGEPMLAALRAILDGHLEAPLAAQYAMLRSSRLLRPLLNG